MSKEAEKEFTPEIYLATKEARELYRIRNSFTFNLGIELIRSIKNPFRIPLLPFRLLGLLFSRKRLSPIFEKTLRPGILIIGIDRIGEKYSLQAQSLCETINDSNLGEISLFNNSVEPPNNLEKVEWYRLPTIREKNKSRKEWNLMVERLLSSVITIARPKHVIFFGDYLYRGVRDALEPLESSIPLSWFLTDHITPESISVKSLPNMNVISVPEYSNDLYSSQSIHRILRRPSDEQIVLIDIDSKNQVLIDSIMQYKDKVLLTAVQRRTSLPKWIDHVVRMKEIVGTQLEDNVILVIDDQSPLLSSLPVLNVPCFLLRTGVQLSPIIDEMVRDMELKGTLVVVRRKSQNEIIQSLDYLISIPKSLFSPVSLGNSSSSLRPTNYVVKWLEKRNHSYN
jgi:hypothetical protein